MSNHKHRQRTTQHEKPTEVTAAKPLPAAAQDLHYRGDRRGQIGTVMGPNTFGEHLTIVEESYDAEADRTTLGLAYGVHEVSA